ncbi:hypothetical protein DIURU_004807 [Diutina rugosa]|uniref:Uncharacterized protein n=1 Tax=Diutina rugosa TaxID=5481 RepID=A0A642UFA8_DIURU|nr:uncharacterized protein DIURU_004807 [Diutina rugosa]KAA8897954.1 hypothetical protein DIURU_004807 [Diutina rugosa]
MERTQELQLLGDALGFTPKYFVDIINNAVNEIAVGCVNSLEKFLERQRSQFGEQIFPKHEIESGTSQFQSLLNSTIDKYMDLFEVYMDRNIFSVPEELQHHIDWAQLTGTKTVPNVEAVRADTDNQMRQVLNDIRRELTIRRLRKQQLAVAMHLRNSVKEFIGAITECLANEPSPERLNQTIAEVKTTINELYSKTAEFQALAEDPLSAQAPAVEISDRLAHLTRQLVASD